tara:strand:+ start:56 stop:1126 length:1071 start_codon:yes stop_codon:yes gene_type:complete
MSDSNWGKGVINEIGWGQLATNDIGAGSIYQNSYSGQTLLLKSSSQSLLLDEFGEGALLAVSMRKLRTDYTGFSMRIQRRGTAASTGTADDQANLHFDSNGYTSLDSPITAVTAGVLSTTLGEFCAAPGYSNPDSMPSADTVEVVKFYNQTEDTTISEFAQSTTTSFNELVVNGVLQTVTIGGSDFVALNVDHRESYRASASGVLGTPLTTFTVTNVKDPAGGFTTEGTSLTPSAFLAESAVVRYNDTTNQFELFDQRNNIQILNSTDTFATDNPYLFTTLIQDATDLTEYYVNNSLQASRTDFTHTNRTQFSRILYDQSNKASGPEFMEGIYYNLSKESDISNINQNIMNFYNLS